MCEEAIYSTKLARNFEANDLADTLGRSSLSTGNVVLSAFDCRSLATGRGKPTMKTILVPTQNIPSMTSALETAVLLAQRTGAYIEGVPLWFGVPEFVVAELATGFSMEIYRARRDDETGGARTLFETFMREHGIPAARGKGDTPSYGWFDEVSPGEALVGSYGRVFDVIETACNDVSLAPNAQVLAVHCAPSLAAKWLAPRLPAFAKACPDITIRPVSIT